MTDNEVHNLDEAYLNEGQKNKKMMYEVNQNGNDIMVVRQDDHQEKTNATTTTNNGAR